jgi:hypothetical protein
LLASPSGECLTFPVKNIHLNSAKRPRYLRISRYF